MDDDGLAISDFPVSHDMVGINCDHAKEAVLIASERFRVLVERDASDEEMRAEMARTDPLYKIFTWVGLQRSTWALSHALQQSWMVLSQADVFGLGLGLTVEDCAAFHEKMWSKVKEIFDSLKDDVQDRLNNLHEKRPDGSKVLVPWNYGDDPTASKPVLTEQDNAVADDLLRAIFGGN